MKHTLKNSIGNKLSDDSGMGKVVRVNFLEKRVFLNLKGMKNYSDNGEFSVMEGLREREISIINIVFIFIFITF